MPRRLRLDLHVIYDRAGAVEQALCEAFEEARRTRAGCLEIVHGKGAGQLKRTVQRFLQRPRNRSIIRNIDHDARNWGRALVFFRWPS